MVETEKKALADKINQQMEATLDAAVQDRIRTQNQLDDSQMIVKELKNQIADLQDINTKYKTQIQTLEQELHVKATELA